MNDMNDYICPFCKEDLSSFYREEISTLYVQYNLRKTSIKTCPHCNEKLSFDPYFGIPLKPLTRKQAITLVIIILITFGFLMYIAK